MSPYGERSDEGRNIRTKQNPLGPQERQSRIGRAKIRRVKTGGPRTLQRRYRQRKPQRRNHQRIDIKNKRTNVKQYDFPTSNKNMCSDNKFHKKGQFNDAIANKKKVDKLVKLEKKYEILQETLKIAEERLVEKEIECASLTEKVLIANALTESNDHPKTSMSTKKREINPSKRKAKKSKSSGRNANKTSYSDENQELAKEKNGLLTTFWIFFRCGQLIFRMADCEVEGTIASPLSIPLERAMSPKGERSDEGRNIKTKQNPLGPQERQSRIGRAFTCRNCGGGDRGRVANYRPFGEVSLSLNCTVTCMVLKANDRRTSCPCHDEFRGPRSDYVRQFDVRTEKWNNAFKSQQATDQQLASPKHTTHFKWGLDLENALAIRDVEYPRCLDNPEQRVFDDILRCRP
ncbi:uncharacterized protein TNCV_4664661 [Trichonephila clavipes]|uniref:Uncharacterized protein n=1 Tax=Trichonephila clavipes TaxID=2585209 RepID=A0A8X6V5N0_TRICX|nr:uncharacterized protein TNCV_4664661 [Trichonephila clavipes]